MNVTVLFFGHLADDAGCSSTVIENAVDLNKLMKELKHNFPRLKKAVYAIAKNHIIVRGNVNLNHLDEIALLPPFAGG